MKKLISLALVLVLVLAVVCSASAADLKIGAIMVGDATEGYTLAHIEGIKAAAAALNIPETNLIWKEKVEETEDCLNAAKQLVANGCGLVISNSYGHQDYMAEAAESFENVPFVAMTGDYAAITGLDNFYNAFTNIYEARYVSGVVAGMKIAELVADGKLIDANYDADGNVKVGYVGAYPYAEVVSGYTAFFLGIRSVVENVSMEVQYTNSWFDIDMEAAAAEMLMADGCVIIGQHADSTGAPTAVEAALAKGTVAYSVGYNVDMLPVAPTAALVSPTNNWAAYYTELFAAVLNGTEIPADWAKGFAADGVAITDLGASCAAGTAEKVAEVIDGLKNGTLKVFDTATFTVGGETVTTYPVNFSCIDFATGEVIYEGETIDVISSENGVNFFNESVYRAAPYFDLRIDGIKELN